MQKAALDALTVLCLGAAGLFFVWVWLKLKQLVGFKVKDRIEKIEEDIHKSTVLNNDTSIEDLVNRENERARNRRPS
jgi:hypothetical protein